MLDSGTIVAVATPEGRGGLAVVRLSGPEALAVARRVLPAGCLDEPVTSHLARLTTASWPSAGETDAETAGAAIDQVVVLPMLAPNSFTGEDTVEFSCHGGSVPARQVTAACRAAGARAAGPGEFSRRAFLNGKLSLDQAEAVADLIAAGHVAAARTALAQLRGSLDRELSAIEQPLRSLLAQLEGAMEFGDDEIAGPPHAMVRETLAAARERVADLLALAPAGRRLREGVQVVLVGPPNAGKSSLFNALLERPRAIVAGEPGTTRDVVSDTLELEGVLFALQDTAGIHAAASGVEAEGVARAREALAGADIVLALTDTDDGDDGAQHAGRKAPDDCIVLPVQTKVDLTSPQPTGDALATSARTGQGLDALRAALVKAALDGGLREASARGLVLNDRHEDRLRACLQSLDELLAADAAGDEIIAGMLSLALQELGAISGRVFTERLLDDVFGRFCVGK